MLQATYFGQIGRDTAIRDKFRLHLIPTLVGVAATQGVSLIGQFYVGEILAIIYVVFQFRSGGLTKFERNFLVMVLLWAVVQGVSDVVNQVKFDSSLKGVFTPVFLGLTTIGLLRYFRRRADRMPAFLVGMAIGKLIAVILFPDLYAKENPWKWGLGAAVLSLLALRYSFFVRGRGGLGLIAGIAVFAAVSLSFDARSLAGFPLISYALFRFGRGKGGARIAKLIGGKWGPLKLLFASIPVIACINFLLNLVFTSSALLSSLPEDSREKYLAQASGEYGMIVGGRSEILISSRAFIDRPLLGHGSWAEDRTGQYIAEYLALRSKLGYVTSEGGESSTAELGLIPVHSYIMGGFVWAGVFGGVFWLYLVNYLLRVFVVTMRRLPYYFYLGMSMFLWNVFFSPFGASARWDVAVFLASLLSVVFGTYRKFERAS